MKKRFRFYLLSAVIGCFLGFIAACSSKDSGDSIQSLSYEMKSFDKVYQDGGEGAENDTYCKFRYPVFSDGEHAETINRYLLNWIANSTALSPGESYTGGITIEELAENFFREYETARKEFPVSWSYQFELTGSVLLNRSDLLTVDLSYYAFTGGAHGNSHTEYFVFDTRTGKRLGLNDVFAEDFEERLNTLIDSRYRQMRGLSPAERLDGEKGILFENYIRFNSNFALTDKGVAFFYNQYEIAAYAYGTTKIDLPYSELAGILKPRFKDL